MKRLKLYTTALCAITLLSVLTTARADERVNRLLDRGFQYLNEFKCDQAIREFDEAIRLEPENDAAYMYRGQAYMYKGDLDKAMSDIFKSEELGSAGYLRWKFRK